jgi:hypothetical protein
MTVLSSHGSAAGICPPFDEQDIRASPGRRYCGGYASCACAHHNYIALHRHGITILAADRL